MPPSNIKYYYKVRQWVTGLSLIKNIKRCNHSPVATKIASKLSYFHLESF
jgi:hypothetical protein